MAPGAMIEALQRSQAVRFIAAGIVNTLFGYVVYLLGLATGLRPEFALLVATAIGAVWNYFTVARFVFAHRGFDRLPLFVGAYAVIYLFNAAAIRLVVDAGVSPAIAQALLLPVVAALSFILFRTFVFRAGARHDA